MTSLLATPPAVPGLVTAGNASLTAFLKTATRDDHLACEEAFALPRRTVSLDAYASMLGVFAALYDAVVPSLAGVLALAPPELAAGLHGRRERCLRDIDTLERLGVTHENDQTERPLQLRSAGEQLGAWYVLEGSVLGGAVISRIVRAALPAAAPAMTFLDGEGPITAARWRRFCRFADDAEHRFLIDPDDAVAGACRAFSAAIQIAAGR